MTLKGEAKSATTEKAVTTTVATATASTPPTDSAKATAGDKATTANNASTSNKKNPPHDMTRGSSFSFGTPGFIESVNSIIAFNNQPNAAIDKKSYSFLQKLFNNIVKREQAEKDSKKHLIWLDHLKQNATQDAISNAQKYFAVQSAFLTYTTKNKHPTPEFRITSEFFRNHVKLQKETHAQINDTTEFSAKPEQEQYQTIVNLINSYGRLNEDNQAAVFKLFAALDDLSSKNKTLDTKALWKSIPNDFKAAYKKHNDAEKKATAEKTATSPAVATEQPSTNSVAMKAPSEASDSTASADGSTPSTGQAKASSGDGEWVTGDKNHTFYDGTPPQSTDTNDENTLAKSTEFAPIDPAASSTEEGVDKEVAALTHSLTSKSDAVEQPAENTPAASTCGRACRMKDITHLKNQLQTIVTRLEEKARANNTYETVHKAVDELAKNFEALGTPLHAEELSDEQHEAAFKQFAIDFKAKLADKTLNDTIHQQRNSLHMTPVIQQLYAVVKAICGLLAAVTVLPVCNLIKWATGDKTPVFERGIYGTFFSQETFTAQDINRFTADAEAQFANVAMSAG